MGRMKEKEMTFEEFTRNLPLIDWFYNMSDDPRAYREGCDQVRNWRELAETKGEKWIEAFDTEQKKHRIH